VKPADDEPVFAGEAFAKSFGGRTVLKNASCRARAGHVTALLGRNGSGKTTLIRAALGLARADNGVTTWRGRAFLRPRLEIFARDGLFFLPAADLLSRVWPVSRHFELLRDRYRIDASADEDPFEIEGLGSRRHRDLSGGEIRRVELSLALARHPRCLVADEPYAALAPRFQNTLTEVLRVLATNGAAILITGHEVEHVLAVADEVVWVTGGGTHVLGSPDDARRHPGFVRRYLGARTSRG